MVLISTIAMTATFCSHLEVNLQNRIRGIKSIFARINFIGRFGAAALSMTIIYARLSGSGILDEIKNGSAANLKENPTVMEEFIAPIALFAIILIIRTLTGSLVDIATYFQNPQYDRRPAREE